MILRRYGRGLRIVGQVLEVDMGDGPDQVPTQDTVRALAPPAPILLALRVLAPAATFVSAARLLWRPISNGVVPTLRVMGNAGSVRSPLLLRLRNESTGGLVEIANVGDTMSLTNLKPGSFDRALAWAPGVFERGEKALLSLEIACGVDGDTAVLERAELLLPP